MSAEETIAKAIENLDEARAGVGVGKWYESIGGVSTAADSARWLVIDGVDSEEGALALVVTLHRTIDAQLAILRDASDAWPGDRERWLFTARQTAGEFWEQSKAHAIDLAVAILGGDQ